MLGGGRLALFLGEAQDARRYMAAVFLRGGMCGGAAEEDVEEHEACVRGSGAGVPHGGEKPGRGGGRRGEGACVR